MASESEDSGYDTANLQVITFITNHQFLKSSAAIAELSASN